MTRVRARLHQLRNHKVSCLVVALYRADKQPMSIPATFVHAREALSTLTEDVTLGITPDFLVALDNEAEEVKKEITALEAELPALKRRLDAIWEGAQQYEYELVSVFMHRGKTSGAGHYWTYQAHLPDHCESHNSSPPCDSLIALADQFFKYNDETVTAVPSSEVLEDRTGSDANPALLCYVRRDRQLVDTLHRELLELSLLGGEEEEREKGAVEVAKDDIQVD